MLSSGNIKKYLLENKWVLCAFIFFIVWKFFLINVLWNDRYLPPGPDDSYIYILHIDSSLNCSNFFSCRERPFNFETYAGFDHLSYRVFLGAIGSIFSLSASKTYEVGFYIGVVLLAMTLTFFLSKLNPGFTKLTAFSLFTLALYNGSGSYHGFYWVVPSFFAVLLFFLIVTIIIDKENKYWKQFLFFLTPIAVFTHILGLYLLIILPIFSIIYSLFSKEIHITVLKKSLYVCLIAILFYLPVSIYFAKYSYGNPYGPEVITKSILSKKINLADKISDEKNVSNSETDTQNTVSALVPGWHIVYSDYFRWIFPSTVGYLIFILSIVVLFYKRQLILLALYFSSLLFVIFSTLSVHGERALIIIWPLTFLLYSQAAWFMLQILSSKVLDTTYRILFKVILIFIIILAVVISGLYAYLWSSYLNKARDIYVSPELTNFLIQTKSNSEKVAYSADMNFLDAYMLLMYGSKKPEKSVRIDDASRYVTLGEQKKYEEEIAYTSIFEKYFVFVSQVLHFNKYNSPQPEAKQILPSSSSDISLEKKFKEVEIYRVSNK